MRFILAFALVMAACGGKSEVPEADAASDTAPSDTASDTAADAPPACFDSTGQLVSVPYKLCMNDEDCTFVAHQTDCCGNSVLVGVASDQKSAVDACEATSRAGFPGCGCPSSAPKAEDGATVDFGATPVVRCTDRTSSGGICKTSKT